jgi:hypothetical protein
MPGQFHPILGIKLFSAKHTNALLRFLEKEDLIWLILPEVRQWVRVAYHVAYMHEARKSTSCHR